MIIIAIHPDNAAWLRQAILEELAARGISPDDFNAEFRVVENGCIPKLDEDGGPVGWLVSEPSFDFVGPLFYEEGESIDRRRLRDSKILTTAIRGLRVESSEPARHSPSMGDGSTGWLPNAEAEAQQQRPADK